MEEANVSQFRTHVSLLPCASSKQKQLSLTSEACSSFLFPCVILTVPASAFPS